MQAFGDVRRASLGAREIVYCGNDYARVAHCCSRFFLLEKNNFAENIIELSFPHYLAIDSTHFFKCYPH